MGTLARVRALSPARRRLASQTLVLMTSVRIGLSLLGLARLQRLLRRHASSGGGPGPAATVEDIDWAVAASARRVPRATCLVQALTMEALLVRSGRPAELRIGVARENGGIAAHAWVETGGRRLLEDAEPDRFAALPDGWQG
jgi:hypothetical protein